MTLTEEDMIAAAEHAAGLDEGDARAASRRRMASDPDFRAEVADWERTLVTFVDEVAEVAPPRRVWRRLRTRLFAGAPSLRARLAPWLLAGAAAAALAVAVLPLPVPDGGEGTAIVAEIATEGDALRVLAAYDPAAGAFRVRRLAGAAPPGRDLELWAIAPGEAPVSLGVIEEDGRAPLPESLRDDVASLTLAVSEEDVGGSRTGVPGTVLAASAVVAF